MHVPLFFFLHCIPLGHSFMDRRNTSKFLHDFITRRGVVADLIGCGMYIDEGQGLRSIMIWNMRVINDNLIKLLILELQNYVTGGVCRSKHIASCTFKFPQNENNANQNYIMCICSSNKKRIRLLFAMYSIILQHPKMSHTMESTIRLLERNTLQNA